MMMMKYGDNCDEEYNTSEDNGDDGDDGDDDDDDVTERTNVC